MSLICRTYACPACNQQYDILQDRDEGSPDQCPKCGVTYETPVLRVPGGFNIGGSDIARGTDGAVRALFDSTEAMAKEHNNPAMKVTNLRDNVKPGEVYAMPNSVPQPSREYQQMMAGGMPVGFGQGAGGSGGQNAVSPQQLIAGVRADGGGVGASPVIQQMVGNPRMPHRRMTGRFQRPK